MSGKTVLFLAAVLAAGYWLYTHRGPAAKGGSKTETPSADSGAGATGGAGACISAAERANSSLHEAGMLLMRPPVDQSSWATAERRVSSDISSAESSCNGGTPPELEAGKALTLIKSSLSDMRGAAEGRGGATDLARRQGEIDDSLNRARVAMGR